MTARGLAAAAASVAALAAAGCGGGHATASGTTAAAPTRSATGHGLAWAGRPLVFRSRNLPNDRVVIAHVRNAGDRTLRLVASEVRVRDASGRALKSSAGFTTSFAHGLFGAFQQPRRLPPAELMRLGKLILLEPDASAPFFAAWRVNRHTKLPLRVEVRGGGSLALPAPTSVTAR